MINEVFAKANFGDRNPLGAAPDSAGSRRRRAVSARDMEIVGVSRNARYGGLTRAIPPVVYMPYDQGYPQPNQMVYALRTSGDPLRYVNSVREIVRQADARVPVSEVRTQAADIDQTINQEITFAEVVQRLRDPGAGDRLRGSLRHRLVQRRAAHRRDRHPDGAGGAARRRGSDGSDVRCLVLAAVGLAIGMADSARHVEIRRIVSCTE